VAETPPEEGYQRTLHPHEKLDAWREAVELVKDCYKATTLFPTDQRYGLVSQIQRAAVSVPANLAEGSARGTPSEARRFYTIARGSLLELDTLITVSAELGFITQEEHRRSRSRMDKVAMMLNGLIRYQKARGTR
jgi:four helix bundle protein